MAKKKPIGAEYKTADHLFENVEPVTKQIYDKLLAVAKKVGDHEVQPKKTCVHLANGSAFCGIHPRKNSIMVTLRTKAPIKSARVHKVEQVSKNRCHNDMKLHDPKEVDAEFIAWLKQSFTSGE